MKFNSKTRVLEFSSDESVFKFHDQLTDIMRSAMSNAGGSVGGREIKEDEAVAITREFFERYSALSDTLRSLRAHLPRGDIE